MSKSILNTNITLLWYVYYIILYSYYYHINYLINSTGMMYVTFIKTIYDIQYIIHIILIMNIINIHHIIYNLKRHL